MLDIEIMKWGCEIADGFRINEHDRFVIPSDQWMCWDEVTEHKLYYPLFLQRVKKGLNKIPTATLRIDVLGIGLFVIDEVTNNSVLDLYDTDEDLEKAIEYIYSKVVS